MLEYCTTETTIMPRSSASLMSSSASSSFVSDCLVECLCPWCACYLGSCHLQHHHNHDLYLSNRLPRWMLLPPVCLQPGLQKVIIPGHTILLQVRLQRSFYSCKLQKIIVYSYAGGRTCNNNICKSWPILQETSSNLSMIFPQEWLLAFPWQSWCL